MGSWLKGSIVGASLTEPERFPVSGHSVAIERFMSLLRNIATVTAPKNRPARIASMGNPGIAGAACGATAKFVKEAESPVEPIAVIV